VSLRVIFVVASTGALPVEADGPPVRVGELPIVVLGAPSCLTVPQSYGSAFTYFVRVAAQADSARRERLLACLLPPVGPVWRSGSGAIPSETRGG
jgi:hypothetical protein